MYDLLLYNLKTGACLAVFYLFYKVLLSRETFHRFNRLLVLAALVSSFLLPLCVITVYEEVPRPEPLPFLPEFTVETTEPAAEIAEPFPWDAAAGVLFAVGAVATLCWTLVSLGRVVRLIRTGRRMPLDERTDLVLHERELTPFSWMRYIVLSERDHRENGREIIVHERAHVALGHSFDLLVSDLLSCVQWFNPAMWLLRQELRAIHEYEADEAVLRSGADARRYQLLLIKKAAGERWYSVANSFNHSKLKNRITMMLRKRSSRWAGAKALFVLPLAGVALGAFAETVYLYPEDKGTEKTENLQMAVDVVSADRAAAAEVAEAAEGPHKVTWYVYDKTTNEPLAGVIVSQEGAKRGAVTDTRGKAVLEVADDAKLAFKMVGYRTVQLTADGLIDGSEVRIGLTKEEGPAEEIVVVTGGVGSLRTDDPLYIVDGEQVEDLNAIDTERIASIDVLKGGSSVEPYVAQYGERAEKGVVVVKLRSGEEQPAKTAVQSKTITVTRSPQTSGRVVMVSRTAGSAEATAVAPLYYVDGELWPEGKSIDELPSDRIASMQVLKEKTAEEQYGAAPGQGVILIRTKGAPASPVSDYAVGVYSLSGDNVSIRMGDSAVRITGNLKNFVPDDTVVDGYEVDGRPFGYAEVCKLKASWIKSVEIVRDEQSSKRTMSIRTRSPRRTLKSLLTNA